MYHVKLESLLPQEFSLIQDTITNGIVDLVYLSEVFKFSTR
ncbi:hypothetical protein HMPREF9700_00876 [Bergeyella zoohelcum CCUG 30536]|nr:hypothetical protein HMPREF9700_00876 [Bergeyella zoohelcum CCUG 30536]